MSDFRLMLADLLSIAVDINPKPRREEIDWPDEEPDEDEQDAYLTARWLERVHGEKG